MDELEVRLFSIVFSNRNSWGRGWCDKYILGWCEEYILYLTNLCCLATPSSFLFIVSLVITI